MPRDQRTLARLQAYQLMEALQGHRHTSALGSLIELQTRATSAGWPEVAFLAKLGRAVEGVIRPVDPVGTRRDLDRLIAEADNMAAPALLSHALGLRAITAAASGDTEAVLADAARGLSLLDSDRLPPLDACTALVVCAAAYNALSLWELVDEIYDRAAALEAACEEPLQAAAIAMNRVLLRLEWASSLLEQGQPEEARQQFSRAAEATALALAVSRLPTQWRTAVKTCETALRLYLDPPADPEPLLAVVAAEQATLRAGGDPEVLPLSETLVALALLQLGRPARALAWLAPAAADSASSGARSFRLWVRAQVLAARDGADSEAFEAYREYAAMLAIQRRDTRRALLAAARSRLAGEALRSERDQLSRDVASDPLTGLGNRRAFDGWLDRDVSRPRETAMLLIDLDHFKNVNDQFGHSTGDEVLRRVGRIISHHVRPSDLALRLGGDEFVIIVEAGPEEAGGGAESLVPIAAARAHAVRQAIADERWDAVAGELQVSASVGVAVRLLAAHEKGAAAKLYEEADRDLYAGKKRER